MRLLHEAHRQKNAAQKKRDIILLKNLKPYTPHQMPSLLKKMKKKKEKGRKLPTPPTSPSTSPTTFPSPDEEYLSDDEATLEMKARAGSFKVRHSSKANGNDDGAGPAVDLPTTPNNAHRPASFVALFSFTPKVRKEKKWEKKKEKRQFFFF